MPISSTASGRRVLGYLSGAPRVSTRAAASASGPRAHLLGVMEALERLGWDVRRYIAGDHLPQLAGRGADRAVSSPGIVTRLGADALRWLSGRVTPHLARRTLGDELDLVYERFGSMQAMGRIFQRAGIPWILETNGPFYYEAKIERGSMAFSGLARRLEVGAYHACDVLVCVSEPLKSILEAETGVDPAKILVVPNAVDPRRFDPDAARPLRPSDALTIGFAGAVLEWQGLDLLFEALAQVRREGIRMEVAILGTGPSVSGLQARAEELGISGATHFLGQVPWDEVPSHLAGFDVGYSGQLCMRVGSMYHSPLKLYEYMAMGLPVLAASHDDARTLIDDGGRGYLFAPGDREGLVLRLREIDADRDQLAEMGREARNAILMHHSWDIRVQKMMDDILEKLRQMKCSEEGTGR